ncbi:MAG: hypothetical protein QGD91_12805 [Actinomycetota bacterium]|nr:hypothetical protein [Actinomycetota bacterium]MDK1104388.1 hypothetical protein [Actinomycetota bacterium]
MSKTQWLLATAVIGLGIFAQIPNHEPMADAQHHGDDGHEHPVMTQTTSRLVPAEAQHATTVLLDVTGMT